MPRGISIRTITKGQNKGEKYAIYDRPVKEWWNEYSRQWARNNPISRSETFMKYHHGIDAEDFGKMVIKQNGLCALCGKPLWVYFVIDHDHKTEKIRGLIHQRCNYILGAMETTFGSKRLGDFIGSSS